MSMALPAICGLLGLVLGYGSFLMPNVSKQTGATLFPSRLLCWPAWQLKKTCCAGGQLRHAVQGAVTLVTMALPVACSLLALLRVEHHRRARAERLQQDRGALAQQISLLEAGQPLSISQDAVQARHQAGPPHAEVRAPALVAAGIARTSSLLAAGLPSV